MNDALPQRAHRAERLARILGLRPLAWFLCLVLLLFATAAGRSSHPRMPCGSGLQTPLPTPPPHGQSPFIDPCPAPDDPLVARIGYPDLETLYRLSAEMDVWEVDRARGEFVALIDPAQRSQLEAEGLPVEIDVPGSAGLPQPRPRLSQGTASIPGFACYRTVEETERDMARLAADNPDLASWLDIGDSYDKVAAGGPDGYDLHALVLTNRLATGSEKGKLLVLAAVHARELATAELAARFAELLVSRHGIDPEITWLLDHNEIHIIPQGNPDGRKWAEQGYLWRKNTDNPDACGFPNYGVDLNRNVSFLWNICQGGCSSSSPCAVTYRGPTPGSEPETQAIEAYIRAVFADQRGEEITDAAPPDTNGIFISLHSYGQLIIYPWDWSATPAPNAEGMRRLGRRMGYHTRYSVCNTQNCLYPIDGSHTDFAYGEMGVAAYTFELGTSFFQSCAFFDASILQQNLDALLYAARVARRPYLLPAGPDTIEASVQTQRIAAGTPLQLEARADDTRSFSNGFGNEPAQPIAAARYSVDRPSWQDPPLTPLAAADGAFDESTESLMGTIDTTGWAPGRHVVFIESQDGEGNWGPPTALFVDVDVVFGLDLRQDPPSALAVPGETVTFTLTVTNTAQAADGITAAVEESGWSATVAGGVWTAAAGAAVAIPVTVTVPVTATPGMADVAVVRVTSTGDPNVLRISSLPVVVNAPSTDTADGEPGPLYFPWILREE